MAGKVSGNGLIRCVSEYNGLKWAERPHTSIVGDLSDFTGTLELDDMPLAVAGSSAKVRLACVKSRFNGQPCVGGGLELGANQQLAIGNLDGQLWVRSVDGSGSLDIKDSADSSQVIAVGAVGIRATGSDSPLARLTVTNDAAVTLRGGGFAWVEGKSGMVRVAEAVSHVYRPASGVQFDVLSGGTLEFGNAEALAAANPALWLDASKTESLQPLVKDDKTTAEVDGHTVVRRWHDCRASQREIYGLNPYTKVGWGAYQISCFPYVLADACNGLSSISFGGASGDSLRRLPFNKKVDVKWAVMVYSAQNMLTADGNMYLGGYCPDKDNRGAAGNCKAAFEGSEESEWSTESVAYNSDTDKNKPILVS